MRYVIRYEIQWSDGLLAGSQQINTKLGALRLCREKATEHGPGNVKLWKLQPIDWLAAKEHKLIEAMDR